MENHIFIILKQKQTSTYLDQELEKLQIENYLKSAAKFFSLAGLKTKKLRNCSNAWIEQENCRKSTL